VGHKTTTQSGAVGATTPIEMSLVGVVHPKNWLKSNNEKVLIVHSRTKNNYTATGYYTLVLIYSDFT